MAHASRACCPPRPNGRLPLGPKGSCQCNRTGRPLPVCLRDACILLGCSRQLRQRRSDPWVIYLTRARYATRRRRVMRSMHYCRQHLSSAISCQRVCACQAWHAHVHPHMPNMRSSTWCGVPSGMRGPRAMTHQRPPTRTIKPTAGLQLALSVQRMAASSPLPGCNIAFFCV